MPAFNLPPVHRSLPLTPPDYIHYPLGSAHLPPVQDGYLYDVGGCGYGSDIVEANEVRRMLAWRSKYGPGGLPRETYEMPYNQPPLRGDLHRREKPYAEMRAAPRGPARNSVHGAHVLPPIRIPDRSGKSAAPAPAPAPKEEKVAGGVATHLDYEMEQMIDFVAEMAKGIIQPNASGSTAFRGYVSQILTSTRLPSSTVMCALHYLATRMTILSDRGVFAATSGHLYHLLTVALMLASKFLDDNTFQNRSWAEVSHIAVGELNTHEREWLADIHWNLHVDTADPQGLFAWIQRWEAYKAQKVERSLEALKLTPVDAGLRRPPYAAPYAAPKYTPPTPVYTPAYEPAFALDAPRWPVWPAHRALSPPSANPSGPATPDWFGMVGPGYPGPTTPDWFGKPPGYGPATPQDWFGKPSGGYAPHPSTAWGPAPLPPLSSLRSAAPSPYYAAQHPPQYGLHVLQHGGACGCPQCANRYEAYGPPGMAPVMG